ncbi:MAG TPA: undecaprenyl-diphosphate phosphatase [Candidatus Cloacimonadota bacterium]|nr:undecaprenyl-diphosphate phosphatase [Candidatus Cloacimonadota bacterium]HOV16196.1 undecaprenyl-diphosphate phosphatase [Candidatus Cloacimonadota bacterium]HQL14863.1 undecaprenyl-diphosphate phosphatase [Candidatus Cloacimonadota bacterium]
MNLINAVLMGLIQGLTEFLPISSSGHLVLYRYFFGQTNNTGDISLEVFLHLGSLLAVIIFFWKDIIDLIASLFHWKDAVGSNKHRRNHLILFYLIIATAVTGIINLLFGSKIEAVFNQPLLVAIFLSVTGVFIFCSDLVKKNEIPSYGMGIWRSVGIGLGQGIAMLPGISRSGTTIAVSIFCGINRADAATFSFLLSLPAILGANLNEFKTLTTLQSSQLLNYLCGALAAFVTGYLVISFLINLIKKAKLKYFAFYCWFISALSVILILVH